ncbi:MAG: hypothetical protein RBT49_16330 [Bacteroidales bacterium]|jgi:hypothetical protein|nr:hypothetical protein [Bacteroidales bacterium]
MKPPRQISNPERGCMCIEISIQEKASNTLLDATLIKQFKEIEQLPDHEQNVIIEVVTAYLRDFKAKQNYLV